MVETISYNQIIYTKCIILLMLFTIASNLFSQEKDLTLEASLVSELQYNLSDKNQNKVKWANALFLDGELQTSRLWKNGMFKVSFWSVRNSFDEPIVDDRLVFSNIDAESDWLICSGLGYEHTFGDFKVFGGIREVNVDYFKTPSDLFFTNSSAGLPPTIALDYHLPAYPFSAVGLHAEYHVENMSFRNSFYNRIQRLEQHRVFNFDFNPSKYGYFNYSEIEYRGNTGVYSFGWVAEKAPHTPMKYAGYVSAEKNIASFSKSVLRTSSSLSLAPKHNHYCYAYFGSGLILTNVLDNKEKDRLGIMFIYAKLQEDREFSTEITYMLEVLPAVYVQPTLNYINNKHVNALMGLLRVTMVLGN